MTTGEQTALTRGVVVGTIMGLALGGIIALFIALRPEFLATLFQ